MSQEQKTQIYIAIIGLVLSASIAFGGVAYASGGITQRVKATEDRLSELQNELSEIRLAVNRVDDRTREADKALARIEGSLSRNK